MVRTIAIVCGMAFALLTAFVGAQVAIQKCVSADGKVSYQDGPCEASKKAAGQVQRDHSRADPAAIQRAKDERARSDQFSAARAERQAADDQARAKADEAEAKAIAKAEADARATAAAEPRYYYVPVPVVVQQATQPPRSVGGSPGITQPPGILDTPAPCTTAQCRKKK
jgi:hypothetical protein